MLREFATEGRSESGVDGSSDGTVRTRREAASGHEVVVVDGVDAVDADRWNDVVERAACGTVFHRHEWLAAIEQGLGHEARHVLVEKDTNLVGLCPNVVVDLPVSPFRRLTSTYPGFGGPLATTDVDDTLQLLLEASDQCCSGRRIVHEIRSCNPASLRYTDAFRSAGYRPVRHGGRFQLGLETSYEDLLAEMSSSKRTAIERGRAAGHEIVEEPCTPDRLARFHRTYERHMERVGGEAYPVEFFEALAGMDDRFLLVTLRIDGEYAGGFLELLDDEQSAVHGFFGAVPEQYFDVHATEVLYDYVFRWAIDDGYEIYDFGGAASHYDDGTFRFKEEFGGRLEPNLYWERASGLSWRLARAGRALYWRLGR